MIIESYSDKYYKDVVALIENFYVEAIQHYDTGLDRERLSETVIEIGTGKLGKVFLMIVEGKCEGLLAGIYAPSLLNKKKIFQEVIWYVNKPFRLKGVSLLKKSEEILRGEGFEVMIMAVLEASKPEKIKSLYERMGYKLFESHYIKGL